MSINEQCPTPRKSQVTPLRSLEWLNMNDLVEYLRYSSRNSVYAFIKRYKPQAHIINPDSARPRKLYRRAEIDSIIEGLS